MSQTAPEIVEFTDAALEKLRAGVTLRSPIYDVRVDRKILLLAAGTKVSESLLQRLRERGIAHVRIDRADLERMSDGVVAEETDPAPTEAARDRRDAYSEQRLAGTVPEASSESFLHNVRNRGAQQYDQGVARRFAESYAGSLDQVDQLFAGLGRGMPADARVAATISTQALEEIADDMDLFVALGLKPESDKYPSRHGLQAAMLAMCIGVCLRLNQQQLVDLGVGCMLHDAGMLRINQRIYRAPRPLTNAERAEIVKHPTLAFEQLRKLKAVSGNSLGVVHQMHERCNGSGYPHRLDGRRIRQSAKIAAVADVFLALISPRPHRPALLPYVAIEQILQDVRRGLYDHLAVRGLLHTTSLFPIGSYVQVNDGRLGRVIRSNGATYARPIVELWSPQNLHGNPDVVDLAANTQISVVRPLASLKPAA
jgi:HD-GYP domain-containing protein (c-di-GMP phosphodiesterase class II)